jgi:hypothetical protein
MGSQILTLDDQMKYFLLLITTLAYWSSSQAAHPYKGYIVTPAGDTQQVFIQPPVGVVKDQRQVVVVDSNGKEIRTYQAGELKAYGFDRTIWQIGRPPKFTSRHEYRQFLTPDSLPVLARIGVLGSKVSGFWYQEKKGLLWYGVEILQKRSGERLYIHFSHGMEEIKAILTGFFNDDANVSAEIKDKSRYWSWDSINPEITYLLQIYNGVATPPGH